MSLVHLAAGGSPQEVQQLCEAVAVLHDSAHSWMSLSLPSPDVQWRDPKLPSELIIDTESVALWELLIK